MPLPLPEWFAAFAMGLQNAITTSFSGAVVRTTHMTGIVQKTSLTDRDPY
jgi:uncharacterized membrane protein YoaK (UPF0700 family)